MLADVVRAGAEVGAHGQAAQVAVLDHHHLLDVGAGKILLVVPRLGHAPEPGQGQVGLFQAGLVVVVELGDEMDDLHALLGIGRTVEGELLLVKVGHKHRDLRDVEHAAGGGDVALAGGDQKHLVVLRLGIEGGRELRAGLKGDALHCRILVGALQNRHPGHPIGILVADVGALRNFNQSHGTFPFTIN